MYSLIQSAIRIFKSLYGIHVNDIPVIIISDEQHEFDIICGVNARAAFETYVRTHLISYPEKHIFFTIYNIRRMLNYIIGCIIILIAAITALIGQSIDTISGGLDEFQTDALKQYPELKIKKPLPTFEEFCYPKNYAVQKQQKFAAEYMKKSKSRELLVFHKIGAGKTCLAIQIDPHAIYSLRGRFAPRCGRQGCGSTRIYIRSGVGRFLFLVLLDFAIEIRWHINRL